MARIYEIYNKYEKLILGIIMLVLIAMGFTQVLCRFVLKVSLAWAEEMMTFCMIWVCYLGASAATNEKKHIMVSVLVDMFPKKISHVLTVLSQIIWLGGSVIMVYLGWEVTANYIKRGAATLGGKYPYWIASIILPISMVIISLRVVLLIIHTIKGEADTRSAEEIIKEEKAE